MLYSENKSSSAVLKTLLCVFSILFICVVPAFAFWQQTYEGHETDISNSLLTGGSGINTRNHGYAYTVNPPYEGSWTVIKFNMPYTGYLAFTLQDTSVSGSYNSAVHLDLAFKDGGGYTYLANEYTGLMFQGSSNPINNNIRIEFIESASGNGIDIYQDGVFKTSVAYSNLSHSSGGYVNVGFHHTGTYGTSILIDDITAMSAHAVIDTDPAAVMTDAGQYYRIGAPLLASTKHYSLEVYSPSNDVVYTKEFDNLTSKAEQLIPIENLSEVGTYTIHLYRDDSDTSSVFLCLKEFDVSDPAATGEGSILIDKDDYEMGETVSFWVHLKEYSSGYKAVCEFPTDGGSNFKKEIPITAGTFKGSFNIPSTSKAIGNHRVNLLNPSGKLVASDDFNVFLPGKPDIAFDKSQYERSEKAIIYYKDAKDNSELSLIFKYGGTTAQTLIHSVEGSGTITVDLSTLAAADSVYAVIKDSDGYANDDDNAKIIVGNFELEGRVYDAKTGAVIPGATVTVQGRSVNSNLNGSYNLTAVAGFANYSVSATGYNGITGTVAVFDLKTIHNFYLSPVLINAGTGVYGTVVSSKTDYPIVGASVEVTNTDNLKRYSTIVDSKGYYSVSHDDLAGNLSIRVSYNNYDSIVSTALVSSGTMQNHNYRLNAVLGYEEIDPSEHTGGQDSDDTGETAEERAYREKYGEMGKHPFDFNGDGTVENSEWKYAFERLAILIGLLAFMGFMVLISRRR